MVQVTLEEAATHLRELIDQVEAGEENRHELGCRFESPVSHKIPRGIQISLHHAHDFHGGEQGSERNARDEAELERDFADREVVETDGLK